MKVYFYTAISQAVFKQSMRASSPFSGSVQVR